MRCNPARLVQSQLVGDAVDGAGQALADRLGLDAPLGGDLGPLAALLAPFESERSSGESRLRASSSSSRAATSRLGVGSWPGDRLDAGHARGVVAPVAARLALDPAEIAPAGPLALHLAGQLVPRHRRQQLEQLVGRLQLILPQRGADEEARHHRLADVHRVEQPVQPGVHQPDPRRPADRRLVSPDQLGRRLLVAVADATDQQLEAFLTGV